MGQAAAALSRILLRFNDTRGRRVLMDSLFADVCHRNDDERLDELSLDQSLRGLIDSPLDAGKRSGGVENVLSIVQI